MKSNYKKLGSYIREVNNRDTNKSVELLLGVSIEKIFKPSIANTIGTDMSTYKIVKRNQFAYGPVTSRNGDKISVALLHEHDEAIVSQAYVPFEVTDTTKLDPEYLMMWFRRPEFDRYARFKSHGSAREIFDWEEMCEVELPIPHIDKQREIVKEYNAIVSRIKLNEQLYQKLEEASIAIFNSFFEKEDSKETHRLGDLIDIKGGFSYNSDDLGNGNSYLLGMGCVSFKERFIEDGMRLYSDNYPIQHLVKPLDIVIATRQQSENMPILGFPAMIPPSLEGLKLVIASNLYRVVNKSILNNEMIYQLLRTTKYQEHIKLHTKGTTVGMITKDAIEEYTFEGPSLQSLLYTQEALIKVSKNVFTKKSENQKLTELKDLLLSKLATIET